MEVQHSDESSHDSLEEIEDISDSGSDFEVQLKAMKRRKQTTALLGPRPPKRPRRKAASQASPNPSTTSTQQARSPQPPQPSLGRTRQLGSPRRERERRGNQGMSAGDMYEAVRSGKSAMVAVVDEWLDSYKQDRDAGLLELINFVVQCCGCKGVVSREMFDGMQNAEIISTLTKEFNEDSVNYPLCSPGPQWRKFRASVCEFVQVLVRSCQNSFLYDEYLFSALLALLTGLSDSQVRAFRHTSTLIAMKLMTGIVEVAVMVFAQIKTTQRRYDAERSKGAEHRASERLEELQATISELREHQEELSSMMNATFRGVFVHRYRDRVAEIRAVCIEEMGVWLRENPGDFLNDGYLKYLGWTLHDKQGSVRLQCVRALQGLYKEKDLIGRLELFTSRFKERMLCMVLDKDPDVAVEAVQLLLLLQQRTEEGLSEEECSHVYPLVFASRRGLASAAGAFLYHKLCSAMSSEPQEADMGSRRAAFFNLLVSFYIQSEFHEHGAYLVDSLWGVAGAELRDWDTMTSLLVQEADQGRGLVDEEEGALIELMMCAVRQAAEGHPPVGRAQAKKILSMKDKKTQVQDKRRITTHFTTLLPQLLAKYSADVEKVTCLLKAPLHFDLETYSSTGRLEKYLDLLLAQVCGIVEKHTESGVLEACARVACALSQDKYTFSGRADLVVSQLLDSLTDRFSSHLNELLQGTADEDEVYSAATALMRIAAFTSAKDLTSWKLFEPCFQLLKSGVESRDIDKECCPMSFQLMVPALKCAAFHVLWEKVRVANSTPTKAEVKRLKKEVCSFCIVCQSCLSVGQPEIRDQAFELLCDMLLLFGVSSVRSQPTLQPLAHPPSDSLRFDMAAFLLDYVFTEPDDDQLSGEAEGVEEVKMATLQRRRNQLAGYCKLVIYGILDLSTATDVFKYYSKFYKDYGDIIKETLSKTKMISPVQSAKTVCLSLQQLFSALAPECVGGGQEFGEIRELAKRLAMSFGIDLHRIRKPLVSLHMDGIRFALREAAEVEQPPPNLPFLEILSEFSFKLLRQDRAQLSAFLSAECGSAAPSWPSLRMYQRSLQSGSSKPREDGERSATLSPHSTPAAKRRRTTPQGSVSSASRGPWLDSSSIHSNVATPGLTSTVQRQPSKHLPVTHNTQASTPGSDKGSIISEPESDDDFSEGSLQRKVEPRRRSKLPIAQASPSSGHCDLESHLTMLSLIEEDEDDEVEEEEPEIEDFESDDSDHDTDFTLPSTRRSTSYLEELFQ
ncbi:cohesin subunit SA-2 isoform X3 [Oncorhynchus kisutch]|uniref:cohesin subunit SA-2 isoform X3 n=1 Tax=Oncorhynchus kisutch TaxID=8019 RepID=UPI0012DC7A96|nr:cohesin subunit SA-2 isoform X3 [Oncorhynchus kisutch]